MFEHARLKLTAWYLLIIMVVSISFSAVIYRVLASELDRIERVEELRVSRGLTPPSIFIDPDVRAETQNRLGFILLGINLLILGGSAVAGYFLAGRTLTPIADMVDEQNRFITDASHELRTPLTALKSEIEVNLRSNALDIAQARKLLQSNLEEVNNLQVLSDGLIKLTQYQKDHNGLPMTNVSLKAVSTEAVRKITAAAKAKNIDVVNKVQNATLTGNQPTLTELLVIFLDNAIKYSKKQKTVKLESKRTDGHIVLRISDQGIGIDEKEYSPPFQPFLPCRQVENQNRRKRLWTGAFDR